VISSLTGVVQRAGNGFLVLDVSGVGYQVFITSHAANSLHVGDAVTIQTALIVREDAFVLFGFETVEELELFDLLRSVTGVGPKSAMTILSQLSVSAIRDAVLSENDSTFKAVSGIGPKTAKLITVTLAGKLVGLAGAATAASAKAAPNVDLANLIQALQGLGWSEKQAAEAVRDASEALGAAATADALLRTALARLGTSKSVSGGDQ
jgi:holliday junction DNA helicase RuvA